MVGYAVTAKMQAHEQPTKELHHAKIWEELARIPKPWVIVIEDVDYPAPIGSYWGEVNASVYAALGAAGVVTNGGVRDLPEVRPTGFHLFASCVLVSHAYAHVFEAGKPVTVGGLTVRPGDLLHADQHGITNIPLEIAANLPDACSAIESGERRLIDYARTDNPSIEQLKQMYGEVD